MGVYTMMTQETIDRMSAGHFDEDLLEFQELASLDGWIDEEIEADQSLMEDGTEGAVLDHMMGFDDTMA